MNEVTTTVALPRESVEAIARRAAEVVRESVGARKSPYLTVDEAADYLRFSKKRIYNLTSAKRIPHRKEGNRLLLIRRELDRWVGDLEGASLAG